jgi:hypothetical protein
MTITLTYESIDGFRERKTFATLVGARRYAGKRVGLDAEAYGVRAISFDGGKLTLVEVMKEPPVAPFEIRDMETFLRGEAEPVGAFEVWAYAVNEDAGTSTPYLVKKFPTEEAARAYLADDDAGLDGACIYNAGTLLEPKWTPGSWSDPY